MSTPKPILPIMLALILALLLISGCSAIRKQTTAIEKITSEPSGAEIYWGKTAGNLQNSGQKTPFERSLGAAGLESWCYQVRKEGHSIPSPDCRDDESGDRFVHFVLTAEEHSQKQEAAVSVAPGNEAAVERKADESNGDYRIGTGDVLEILVWKEADLSRKVSVRPDGKISLPLIDDVQASGQTPTQLKEAITKALGAFIEHPSVSVILQENNSKVIHVIGKVKSPGMYVLHKATTVLQAIASAGGFQEWAKIDDISVMRTSGGQQRRLVFNYSQVIAGKNLEQNVSLQPNDVIVVP